MYSNPLLLFWFLLGVHSGIPENGCHDFLDANDILLKVCLWVLERCSLNE